MPRTAPSAPQLSRHAMSGTVLAFDFGTRRIGAAVGDRDIGIAHPLTTIPAAVKEQRYAAIRALIEEWQPALLVVGLPAHMDGAEHEVSRLARKFARELAARFRLHVELVDERLTSACAEASIRESGSGKRKSMIDQVAAQQILQDYFDQMSRSR